LNGESIKRGISEVLAKEQPREKARGGCRDFSPGKGGVSKLEKVSVGGRGVQKSDRGKNGIHNELFLRGKEQLSYQSRQSRGKQVSESRSRNPTD